MGSAEYGRIGQRLRGEYAYLQGFVRDLIDGRISSPMAVARIGLYAQSVRGSYWQGTGDERATERLLFDAPHTG
jgi:hypothetical protein